MMYGKICYGSLGYFFTYPNKFLREYFDASYYCAFNKLNDDKFNKLNASTHQLDDIKVNTVEFVQIRGASIFVE